MLKLRELINDIVAIEKQTRRFETKYGVLSNEFYQAFTSGELSEFDAYDEYRMGRALSDVAKVGARVPTVEHSATSRYAHSSTASDGVTLLLKT